MEEKFIALQGGIRPWWDVKEQGLVQAAILYLAQGCPDWGETNDARNELCAFCSLPHAAANYREIFYGGEKISQEEHFRLFRANLQVVAPPDGNIHTLMVFNAGSFLADIANAPQTQSAIAREVKEHPTIKRLVVESRAGLITNETLGRLMEILAPVGKKLTIRIGVETQDDHLRLKVLRKGHTRRQLKLASVLMREYGVTSGGYVLLNPTPGLDPEWAVEETKATIDWILGDGSDELGMDEVYFCSTNVGHSTPLTLEWQNGEFRPATLWMVLKVLQGMEQKYGTRVHLLPFKDEPELLAVPSNHIIEGVPQDLSGATGCDLDFHKMFGQYRQTMDRRVLVPPTCECQPEWF